MVIESKRGGQVFVSLAYVSALFCALAVGRWLTGQHPILVAAVADFVATVVVFLFSVWLDNSSVYDPYWSVAPLPIALYWTKVAEAGTFGLRQGLILALLVVWGARLTTNWVWRWRGPIDEDFRYVEIRHKAGRAYWPASFVAIHLMPTIWVFLGLIPIFPALVRSGFTALDATAALLTTSAITVETLADWQLRKFLRSPLDPNRVLDSGLWSLCRHPNYLGEILFWWGLFLFGVAADPSWAWSVIGPIAITLLFVFVSAPWMDRRMLARHSGWALQMKKVRSLLPLPR
jgi:steroid 5-alpha reductase family enzyme